MCQYDYVNSSGLQGQRNCLFNIYHNKITNNTYAEIIQYDNPLVILLRNGKKYDYPTQTKIISGKKIVESKIRLNCDDVFVVMSDGQFMRESARL